MVSSTFCVLRDRRGPRTRLRGRQLSVANRVTPAMRSLGIACSGGHTQSAGERILQARAGSGGQLPPTRLASGRRVLGTLRSDGNSASRRRTTDLEEGGEPRAMATGVGGAAQGHAQRARYVTSAGCSPGKPSRSAGPDPSARGRRRASRDEGLQLRWSRSAHAPDSGAVPQVREKKGWAWRACDADGVR